MGLKYTFEIVDLGEELILVPVGDSAKKLNGILKLNKAGKEIIDLIQKGYDEREIVHILETQYDNETSELESYVHKVIIYLRDNGIIT